MSPNPAMHLTDCSRAGYFVSIYDLLTSMKIQTTFCALIPVLLITIPSPTFTQQPPPTKKDPQSAFEPRSSPRVGQKYLERFVGEWEVVKTFYPRQGEPSSTKGTCRQTMIHESRFLQSEFTFDGPSGKTTGTGLIGFESDTGLFTSTWVDSRST